VHKVLPLYFIQESYPGLGPLYFFYACFRISSGDDVGCQKLVLIQAVMQPDQ
jgi:hypothetical protein